MSLLMDALRKAEADKKQADSTAKEDDAAGTPAPAESRANAREPAADADPSINVKFAELALEPLAGNEQPVPAPQLETEGPAEPNGMPTVQSRRGSNTQVDASIDGSAVSDRPSANARAATGAGPRDSGITETVASPHTVFEAGAGGPPRRVVVWSAASVSVIACLLFAAAYFYFQQGSKTVALPSPMVAVNVEKPPPKPLPEIDPGRIATDLPNVPGTDTASSEPETLPAEPTQATVAQVEPVTDTVATAAMSAPPELQQTPETELKNTPDDHSEITAAEPPAAPETAATAPGPELGVGYGEVRIARRSPAPKTEPLLNEAYAAYVAGDFATSKRLYEAVLAERPDRRDALLGLAALRLRDGDEAGAHELYRRVLQREPDNPTATAALYSIEGGAGGEITESRLKLLLDEGVDVGYIYFSLGNLYARNERWADAQQAYFEALRNYPRNADYNYNLAVSLDRIGQRATAAKYYAAAVDLADAGTVGFDPASALARLRAIRSDGE